MIERLLQIIAPHHCYGCGEAGTPLCANCKYNIVSEPFSGCIVCAGPSNRGICFSCQTTYEQAWCVGDRTAVLAHIVDAFKFNGVRAAHHELAELLDSTVAILPADTIIVPVATIPAHIRQRGYDHTALLAKRFAKRRNLQYANILTRQSRHVQRGMNKRQRMEQAATAFLCTSALPDGRPCLLIDDVVTTNATVRYAAQALLGAGATSVWVAVLARQPLEKKKASAKR